MEILTYSSPLPPQRQVPGSFVDRNPNLSYLLVEGNHSVMVDACSDVDSVIKDLNGRDLQLDSLLITHYHPDHTFALTDWIRRFPGLPVGVHALSLNALASTGKGINRFFELTDGMTVNVGEETIRVIATPGHTRDSICFWDEKGQNLLTGDAVFGGHIGCSDYNRGGNRNIFYQTIVKLLKILPPTTHLYPGHRSEYYQTPPPYELNREKTSNPYLANALAGKKGNFDRALKHFSLEFETAEVVMLNLSDIDAICDMEKEIWIPELQASREVILDRLQHGHKLLTLKEDGAFTGMVGWCYSFFSLTENPERFPHNFQEFSNCSSCCPDNASSAFIYNVGVMPNLRRQGAGSLMLQEAFEKIRQDGIYQVFIDSRMASYNGSSRHYQENVARNQVFHEAVDSYFITGLLPEVAVIATDSTVSFYMKNGLTPWLIRRDFIPDEPSGNMRIICQGNLDLDQPLFLSQPESS